MKKYGQLFFYLACCICLISSCKLDPPILPGQPGYVADVPPIGTTPTGTIPTSTDIVSGTTTTANVVNNSNLSGNWVVKSTTAIGYNQLNAVVTRNNVDLPLFTAVTLDEQAKSAQFEELLLGNSSMTYTLSIESNNLYIQLSEDPFSRTANAKIQISNLTATAMTWLAPDPMVFPGGAHSSIEVMFTK